jgi:pimeloyl-ACP methyl ester carboxylesterase
MKEHALLFGKSRSLVGILTESNGQNNSKRLPAVIILNSGLVHHIGPNRLSVKLARCLAESGFVVFRIDFSGIGDSPASSENMPILERWIKETRAAMDLVAELRGIDRFILLGNCSGAGISFLTAKTDARVAGAVLINFQGEKTLLRYFLKLVLFNPKAWLRIIKGSVKISFVSNALVSFFHDFFTPETTQSYGSSEIVADFEILKSRDIDLLLVYSEWDPGLSYFKAKLRKRLSSLSLDRKLKVEVIPGINHDFGLLRGQEDLIRKVSSWASEIVQGRS